MQSRPLLRILPLVAIAGAGACGVGPHISRQLSATKVGDLGNPPADRGAGRPAPQRACGRAAPGSQPSAFARTPYLQQVTAGSADLSWVSTTDANQSVVISATDGTVVASAPAARDTSAVVASG